MAFFPLPAGVYTIHQTYTKTRTLFPGDPSALAGSGEAGRATRLKSGVHEKTSRGFRLCVFVLCLVGRRKWVSEYTWCKPVQGPYHPIPPSQANITRQGEAALTACPGRST